MNKFMAIDLKSFYASVECNDRGLDIFTTPLVVADISRGEGTITLATTPYLKDLGVRSRARVFEIPEHLKKITIFAKPRMGRYIEVSQDILNVYLTYFDKEDIIVYSIDEVFINITPYLDYYKKTAYDLAYFIKSEVFRITGIHSAVGIGDSLVLSKFSLDIFSKKTKDGIDELYKEDVEAKLWPITPLSKLWGIGEKTQNKLNSIGIFKAGDIATTNDKTLKKHFGIMGLEMKDHVLGIDNTNISDRNEYVPKDKSIGNGHTLYLDYYYNETLLLILEICDKVAERLREINMRGKVVHLSVRFSKKVNGAINKQVTLNYPTDLSKRLYEACYDIFTSCYDNEPVRYVGVSVSKLSSGIVKQLDLFGNIENDEKDRKLYKEIDKLNKKFGNSAVLRASSKLEKSTVAIRNKQIGGHNG